jgi:hypothetical protein
VLKPIRLFLRSLRQFMRGFGPALALAFVCLALQRVGSAV